MRGGGREQGGTEWVALRLMAAVMLQRGRRDAWRGSTGRHVGRCLEGAGCVVWQEKERPGRCVSEQPGYVCQEGTSPVEVLSQANY